ncbi:MAG TPA: YggS family pyridoxal phosphate-dependent enzyme [Casimicrobiaceae bacterium]|nr:YggS family pyridoxal phosphate-dependent enzyme [Casimicrobiaceae bacterium]
MSQYEKTWQAARERIAAAARAVGRDPAGITLLAVSKTFPAAKVREAYAIGQRCFGENYVQEAVAKQAELADLGELRWHFIGPLQSNKARIAAARFDCVETVDRLDIARRLSSHRPPEAPDLDVLIQVNVSGEVTKSGVSPTETVSLARAIAELPRLRVRGIMGIPAPEIDPVAQRAQFRRLKECFDACVAAGLPLDTLSMGMSADLEAAIAEGATEVRLGTALFGPRPAKNVLGS